MTLVMMVAADLARDPEGKVLIGPETKRVCDRAMRYYWDMRAKHGSIERVVLAATAGIASAQWDTVHMGGLMVEYCKSRGMSEETAGAMKASAFNTDGEMTELATYLHGASSFKKVVLVARWWHAPRSYLLCKYRLRTMGVRIPVRLAPVASSDWLYGIAYEMAAIPHNLMRMLRQKSNS